MPIYVINFAFASNRLYPVDANRLDDGRGILESTTEADVVLDERNNGSGDFKRDLEAKTEKKTN